jgi:ubiquinone/menaquinone biosynthesis C-methylase UbiE
LNFNPNSSPASKSDNVWSLGSYNEFAIFILPVSAHLVRLCNISSGENILDVACGTGNTAITARMIVPGIKVTGIDFTSELLTQAKDQAILAEVDDIKWKEENIESLSFEDEVFDAVLSSFGHMFAAHPQVAVKEMIRVTKPGGQIAFSTWPIELVNGRLFKAMAKHLPTSVSNTNSIYSDNQSEQKQHQIISSPIQWGNPDLIQRILQENSNGTIEDIHFERGFVKIPVLSPNHYWKMMSTRSGPVIQAIQAIKEPSKIEALKKDVLKAIAPYHKDNELKLDYLITRAKKNKQ